MSKQIILRPWLARLIIIALVLGSWGSPRSAAARPPTSESALPTEPKSALRLGIAELNAAEISLAESTTSRADGWPGRRTRSRWTP